MDFAKTMFLRIFLIIIFLGLLVVQIVILPMLAGSYVRAEPTTLILKTPLVTLAILFVVCAQVVLLAIWQLLSKTISERIFEQQSMIWVNVMIGAIFVAALLCIVVAALVDHNFGLPPLFGLAIYGTTLALITMALIVAVMKDLLRKAIESKRFIDEVV